MDYIGVSAKQVGVLITVEMLAATLCIIPASHFRPIAMAASRCYRDVHHVHIVPNQSAHVAEFFPLW